jgi:hypothetical protein
VIRRRSGSLAVAVRGKLSGRLVTYVRMTRPLKPDEGGTNGRLTAPVSLSDSRKPAEKSAEPPKPQPHAAESGTRWGSTNGPWVQPTRQIIPARNLGSDPRSRRRS